ncbi:hypothetical protein PR048_005801 [Dryococelus australis]|uniref:Uncharacterized protein n=1 Tax=Dryococelus australis TaxID=614101 RepID=A0ABQ9IAF3_9NEOP|nr:hypothetical protein PR048_005801 [Dryococelus australis]
MGDPRENPPANGIARHDSHMRKSGRVFSGISLLPCPFNLALLHTHLHHPHRSRPNLFTHSLDRSWGPGDVVVRPLRLPIRRAGFDTRLGHVDLRMWSSGCVRALPFTPPLHSAAVQSSSPFTLTGSLYFFVKYRPQRLTLLRCSSGDQFSPVGFNLYRFMLQASGPPPLKCLDTPLMNAVLSNISVSSSHLITEVRKTSNETLITRVDDSVNLIHATDLQKCWRLESLDACPGIADTAQPSAADIGDGPAVYKLLQKYSVRIGKRATDYTETNFYSMALRYGKLRAQLSLPSQAVPRSARRTCNFSEQLAPSLMISVLRRLEMGGVTKFITAIRHDQRHKSNRAKSQRHCHCDIRKGSGQAVCVGCVGIDKKGEWKKKKKKAEFMCEHVTLREDLRFQGLERALLAVPNGVPLADLPWRSRLGLRRSGVREVLGSNPMQGIQSKYIFIGMNSLRPIMLLVLYIMEGYQAREVNAFGEETGLPREKSISLVLTCEILESVLPGIQGGSYREHLKRCDGLSRFALQSFNRQEGYLEHPTKWRGPCHLPRGSDKT